MISKAAQNLAEKYARALQDYLDESGETALQDAYELGRQAMKSGLGIMDIASAYHAALAAILSRSHTSEENVRLARKAKIFFTESLSSFEMAQRGFQETIVKLHDLNETLEQQHEQLRALSAHLESLREQERTRLAREIHDELGQALTGLKMDLAWLQRNLSEYPAAVLKKLTSMSHLIDLTGQAVQRISSELRTGILDDLGLHNAIEWQMQEFQARTGISCKLTSKIAEDLVLARGHSTAVFRIFQETLINVARHAYATRVKVLLKKENSNLVLQVRDNGRGITDSEIADSKSFGIMGMRERTYLFHGDMQIYGRSGQGTTITVRIPLGASRPPHGRPRKTATRRKEER